MRLIDANAYPCQTCEVSYCHQNCAKFIAWFEKTVDAVEVVRCKDCKSWEQYNACDGSKPHRCMNLNAIFYMRTAPDDFCSYGERRTGP